MLTWKKTQKAIENQYLEGNRCVYTEGIYFEGDFSQSWKAANDRYINQSNMFYSVWIENCAQTSLDLLGRSIYSSDFWSAHYYIRKKIVPHIYTFFVSVFWQGVLK